MNEISIIPITGIPEISKGDDLASLTLNSLENIGKKVQDKDIFVVTQKIISKSEGMDRDLNEFTFDELINLETDQIIRKRGDLVIARTKHGIICANAGIDKSNIDKSKVLLLPRDPNKSADNFRNQIEKETKKNVAVIITDTFGRAWRKGQVNFAIGSSGITPLNSYIGEFDTFGNELFATEIAIIDEIASAAELVMEKSLNIPVALIRNFNYENSEENANILIRDKSEDFFL